MARTLLMNVIKHVYKNCGVSLSLDGRGLDATQLAMKAQHLQHPFHGRRFN
jgi:hypothetical protein